MHPIKLSLNLLSAAAIGLFGGLLMTRCQEAEAQQRRPDVLPQNVAPCWPVPNGANNTIMCSNGFWRTITPEGEEFTGMGVQDPNMQSIGGNFVINKSTGGPNTNIMSAPIVTPPMQTQPTVGPGQNELYGNPPRQ